MDFHQDPPQLGNQYDDDALLRSWVERTFPPELRRTVESELREMGALAAGPLHALSLASRKEEPRLLTFDAWGQRVDEIQVPDAWKQYAKVAAEWGLVAVPYERKEVEHSRTRWAALVHLFGPSSSIYTCPLAMTDGAATTLLAHGNRALVERAVPRLTSRDPALAWTSGQWMTERTGGSDVGQSLTRAVAEPGGERVPALRHQVVHLGHHQRDDADPGPAGGKRPAAGRGWRSSTSSYATPRDGPTACGSSASRRSSGTRMLPTAEIELDGARGGAGGRALGRGAGHRPDAADHPDLERALRGGRDAAGRGAGAGLRPAALGVRRAARRRRPLHVQTLADLEVEAQAAFLLTFRVVELLGLVEAEEATEEPSGSLLRTLQPVAKLHHRASRRWPTPARCSRRSAARATWRTPDCRAAPRRAGAAHLGGDHQRALPRPAPRAGGGRGAAPDRGGAGAGAPRGQRPTGAGSGAEPGGGPARAAPRRGSALRTPALRPSSRAGRGPSPSRSVGRCSSAWRRSMRSGG